MRPSNVLALMLGFLVLPAVADTLRLDVGRTIDIALSENPAMAATAAMLSAKEWELKAASKAWSPSLSLEGKTLYGSGNSTSFFALQNTGDPVDAGAVEASGPYASLGLLFALPLYAQGEWINHETPQQAEAQAKLDKSRADGGSESLELAGQVFKNYIGVLEAGEVSRIYGELIVARARMVGVTQRKVAAQTATRTDLAALLTAQAASTSEARAAERKMRRELDQLRAYLGLQPAAEIELDTLPELPALPGKLEDMLAEAMASHPDLRVRQAEITLAEAQLKAVQNDSGPSLGVNATLFTANGLQGESSNTFYNLGLVLNVPLLDSSGNAAMIGARNASLTESRQRLLAAQYDIAQKLREAYDALLDAQDSVEAEFEKLRQSRIEEEALRKLLEKGATTLDRLVAQENLVLGNRISLIRARYKAWTAYADLLQATGQSRPSAEAIRAGA
ncbi:MAG: hypothetical protein B7Y26_09240 [Hydrogenophilales bacterium 16-64-46]|nr:MAG: hypothetical protein B7Z32_12220 [Hydrogenophilales bacterium 12-64-13]OYZ05142.1 MAG: hypothetical protein B7Y26_09240 [Hydrogenophilales bacterium 16-64-46]OZA37960.1 MAG: hypothetical protein B7X87_09170 [Hydrogenophilales bacterium 17-64-34]HQT00508.1 TolC family protein [Thiobacillus sp.]